jgi:hypothetical protein
MRIEEVVIMTTKGKIFRFGMVGLALIVGLALAGCKQEEYEGTSGDDLGSGSSDGIKTVTITLDRKSYKIEYAGHTAEGDAKRTGINGFREWEFTSGGTGNAGQYDSKTLKWLDYRSPDDSWYVYASKLGKKAVVNGNSINIDDIEVIIIDDED